MLLKRSALLLIVFMILGSVPSFAQRDMDQDIQMKTATLKHSKEAVKPGAYPLDYCIVTGEKLGSMGEPVTYNYKGREIKFCCQGCVATFEKDPETFTKKLDDAIIADQKDSYPYTKCPVTGETLGEMGPPVDMVYNNQLVRFCCPACPPKFKKDPEKYMKILHSQTPQKMEMHKSGETKSSHDMGGMDMHDSDSHGDMH